MATSDTGGVGDTLELPEHHQHQQHVSTISERVTRIVDGESIVGSHSQLVDSFLFGNAWRDGPIVIKTSTADFRDRSHEPEAHLLESIFSLVRSRFPKRRVLLADGPAFAANYLAIAESHGWLDLAARYRVDVCDLNGMMAGELFDESVYAASIHREAALTVSMVKAKTHRRTGISGAEKALIGYLSGDKMGYPKLEKRHYLLPSIYLAIQSSSSPTLHIIDGYNAIEGNGPMRGMPMATEFLLIGEDPAALDIELCRLYNFDPTLVISLFHSLKASASAAESAPSSKVPATLLTTERSMLAMASAPARPPREQPWLYRSLGRQNSWRNRRTFNKIRKAFLDVGPS